MKPARPAMMSAEPITAAQDAALSFPVALVPPELGLWRAGNTGVAGFTSFNSGLPGPHVLLLSLVHGNEFAGAIVLDQLLRAKFRPLRGRITFGFANLAAFDQFDPANPTASRYVDQDLNRVWTQKLLAGPERGIELDRARAMRPLLESADILLDLHSMLWLGEPLILSGPTRQGQALATALGTPGLVVADRGHKNGARLIDHHAFTHQSAGRTAILVEGGAHWQPATVECLAGTVAALLRLTGLAAADDPRLPGEAPQSPPRVAHVTTTITAASDNFHFMANYRGGNIIPWRDTLIARDGEIQIRTEYDNCLLVMPSARPARGHTAVRLAQFEEGS
jgi:predicted deacylase